MDHVHKFQGVPTKLLLKTKTDFQSQVLLNYEYQNQDFNLATTFKVRILTPVHTTMSHCEFIEPSRDDEKSLLWAWDTIITLSYQTNSVSAVTKLSLLI